MDNYTNYTKVFLEISIKTPHILFPFVLFVVKNPRKP